MIKKDWRAILKDIEAEKSPNDSLELGDSWRGMPRRTEGVANKTNGLYRRSVLPQNAKNIYNIVIEKQPIPPSIDKRTNLNFVTNSEAAAMHPQKSLIPNVKQVLPEGEDENESFNFTQFLNGDNNDIKTLTSTPFPLRRIDVNKSPKPAAADVQRLKLDSQKKMILPVPTRIPITTPRSSRIPTEQRLPDKQGKDINDSKMSSSVVSSTVDSSSEEGDVEFDPSEEQSPEKHSPEKLSPEKQSPDKQCSEKQSPEKQSPEKQSPEKQSPEKQSPEKQSPEKQSPEKQSPEKQSPERQSPEKQSPEEQPLPVIKDRMPPATEILAHNFVPCNESHQEQEACGKASDPDEALFRRPTMVRQLSQKQNKLDRENETAADRSGSVNNSQRNKKPKRVDVLLENYIKVGESIINKTNGELSQNSTSSLRRRLYKKGDSCNEEEINQHLNPVPTNEIEKNSTKIPAPEQSNVGESTTGNNRNVDIATVLPKTTATTTDCQPEPILPKVLPVSVSASEKNDMVDITTSDDDDPLTPIQSPSVNEGKRSLTDEPSQHASSNDQDGNTRKDGSKANSIDQQNPMSVEHSRKQVLDEILEDWSDTSEPQNENGRSASIDSDQAAHQIQQNVKKLPPNESRVRQVRSKNQQNPKADMPSSKNTRKQPPSANKQSVDEDEASEEEETNLLYNRVGTSKESESSPVAKRTDKNKKKEAPTKSMPSKSNQQQHENITVVEDDPLDSTENGPIVEVASNESTRRLRAKNAQLNYEEKVEPLKKSRPKKRLIANETVKSQVKAKPKRLNVGKDATETNGESSDDVELPKKPRVKAKNKRVNVEEDDTEMNGETDGNVVEVPTRRQVKAKKKRGNVEEDDTETNGETDGNGVELPTKRQVKAKKTRGNVEEDEMAINVENIETNDVVELPQKSKVKARNKRVNVENAASERNAENGETDGTVVELPTKRQVKTKKTRGNVEEDETEMNGETDGNVVEVPTRPQVKAKKTRGNVEEATTETNNETNANDVELPKKSKAKPKKKRLNVEEDETNGGEAPTNEIDGNPPEYQTGDDTNKKQSPTKSESLPSRKRKHQSNVTATSKADASNNQNEEYDTQLSGSNSTVARKHKKCFSKWERPLRRDTAFISTEPRTTVQGTRHSTRPPENDILITFPKKTAIGLSMRVSTRQNNDSNIPPKRRRIQGNENENVFTMLLNGTIDKEPPLISRLRGVEITQGFHKTVKNNLVIHHIPGETGPSYGYFTMEPGTEKRSCRISLNLHMHVVSGPVVITIENESETMKTGSFASLPSGTKYSLRNDGENSALIFFSQHAGTST